MSSDGLLFVEADPNKSLVKALDKVNRTLNNLVARSGPTAAAEPQPKVVSVQEVYRRLLRRT